MALVDTKTVKTIYGTFQCRSSDLITRQLERFSAHTRNELAMLRSFVAEGDSIIDVGAHIGTFAIPFAHFNGGRGTVFAIEANPESHALLVRNIELNGRQGAIVPIHAVAADADGTWFSRNEPDAGNTGACYFTSSDGEEGAVQSIRIDDWYASLPDAPPIALIKVDVEGAELPVLHSIRRLVAEQRPILYVEINAEALARFGTEVREIEDFLQAFGYAYFRNAGERNSTNDEFRIACLEHVADGGGFFDLLAVHPDHARFPKTRNLVQ
jgi:FkbM family methyltransferase